jgi:4-oxalmesaconate hydratase
VIAPLAWNTITAMIVDIHGHLNAPPTLYAYEAGLLASRGTHGPGRRPSGRTMWDAGSYQDPGLNEETWGAAVQFHLTNMLDQVGTDVQFLSPRPYHLMNSEKPERIVHYWVQANNDAVALCVKLAPNRYRGVAGLPQCAGALINNTFEEIDRCINELGFVGILINPDPNEGVGMSPGMGDEYWYPLYEKMVRLNIPALIHSGSCKDPWDAYFNHFITTETRCIISMVANGTFDAFPDLKIIVCHGGGAVPYQVGLYRAFFGRHFEDGGGFDARLKKFYFDTVLYSPEAIELLVRTVGSDRCMFGTENPGAGTYLDPASGKMLNDLKPVIEGLASLTDTDRSNIFENVVKQVFPRFQP